MVICLNRYEEILIEIFLINTCKEKPNDSPQHPPSPPLLSPTSLALNYPPMDPSSLNSNHQLL